jgi:hypothetical protein
MELFKYSFIIKDLVGIDVGAEQCFITILKNNEAILEILVMTDI